MGSALGKGGGGKGGGGSGSEKALSRIAQEMYTGTAPIRGPLIEELTQAVGPGYDPATSPMFDPLKRGLEGQYGTAREGILAGLPAGGVQQEALANLETGRAQSLSDMMAQIQSDMLNRAYGAAFQAPGQAMTGLAQAGQLGAQRQAGTQGMLGQLGMGLGYFLGGQ